ncbi:hypothetical protein AX17_004729 [Amanita inopinata Kibby_2008]|nr:hypothetical protein AX17_004729 [Amanita inopinata Kibby_2008]
MARRRRLAFAIPALVTFAYYFIPTPTPRHIYLANGLLQVNPDAPHPIYELIQYNKAQWEGKLARASRTLPQAIAEYKRRYKRPPPKGFDVWFEWARNHNVQLLDEYDSITRDLEPFWGVSPSDLRDIQAKQELTTDTFTIAKNASENPTALARVSFSDPETWEQRALLRGLDEILALLEPVDHLLPNFRLIFSPHDNPNLLSDHAVKQAFLDAAREGIYVNPTALPEPTQIGYRASCPPGSPARPFTSLNVPINQSIRPPPRTSPKTFIHAHRPAMDPCAHPYLFYHHAQYVAHDLAPVPLQPHLAMQFAYCSTPLFHDLQPPSFIAWVEDAYPSENDVPWEEKMDERVMWRGSNTGMNHDDGTRWKWSQRIRLVNVTSQLEGYENVLLPSHSSSSTRRRTPVGTGTLVRRSLLNPAMTDIAFTGHPLGCDPPYCDYLSTLFDWQPKHDAGSHSALQHKYLVDVDGNGWSSRFKRLITSNALVFKATAYPEWWLDRVQEWVHYVPIQVDWSDLYDVLVFFRGEFDVGVEGGNFTMNRNGVWGASGFNRSESEKSGEGKRKLKATTANSGEDELAKEIARAGREWSKKFWRREDMTAYFWRMILEMVRLVGERDGQDDLQIEVEHGG